MQTDTTFYVKTKVQILGTEVEMYTLLKPAGTTSAKPPNSTELVTSNCVTKQKTNTEVSHLCNSSVNTGLLPVVSRATILKNNTKLEKISRAPRKRCSTKRLNAPCDFIKLEYKNSVSRVKKTTLMQYAKEISQYFTTLPLKSLTADLSQKIARIRKCGRENNLPPNIKQILDQTPNWSYFPNRTAKSTNIVTNIKFKNDISDYDSDNDSDYLPEDDVEDAQMIK